MREYILKAFPSYPKLQILKREAFSENKVKLYPLFLFHIRNMSTNIFLNYMIRDTLSVCKARYSEKNRRVIARASG